jgi:hypothetical protein
MGGCGHEAEAPTVVTKGAPEPGPEFWKMHAVGADAMGERRVARHQEQHPPPSAQPGKTAGEFNPRLRQAVVAENEPRPSRQATDERLGLGAAGAVRYGDEPGESLALGPCGEEPEMPSVEFEDGGRLC